MKADVVEDALSLALERHVVKRDLSLHVAEREGVRPLEDGRLHVEDLVDAGEGCLASLEQVDGPSQREHRPGEHADVRVERHQPSDAELSPGDEQAACPEENQRGNGTEEVDEGEGQSPDRHEPDIAALDVHGTFPQSSGSSLLTGEDLDDPDARHGLLHIVAQGGERVLHALEQPEYDRGPSASRRAR